jgi:nitrite reductase/ring-hydroxylating ferredoxin subunit/uncharacterized membrane protein
VFAPLKRFIDDQTWLDSLGDPLQKYVVSLYSNGGATGKQIQNVLNGVWLGHPLHPVLTDVPVGAWTVTTVLDNVASLTNNNSLEGAADLSLATGLVAAYASAASGWTDWMDTYGEERKVGLFHGLIMVATTITYSASLVARIAGARSAGVALSNTGYVLLSAGAYLGGEEVYDLGYPVNHTAFEHGPTTFVPVMPESELTPGKPAKGDAQGTAVLLVKLGEQVYALDDTCVHAGCSLAGGHLEGATIVCPCHGSQYDLRDGSVINGPATMPEPHYETRIENGMVEVKLAEV